MRGELRGDREEDRHLVELAEPIDHVGKRHVGEPVPIGREEHLVVAEVALDGLEALGDRGVGSGVGERDSPVGGLPGQHLDVRAATVALEDEVVGEGLVVVEEVLLDHLRPVSEAEDELLVAPGGVVPHDVPQHRPVTDPEHRLGDPLRLLAHPDPEPAAEDHDLHRATAFAPDAGVELSDPDFGACTV